MVGLIAACAKPPKPVEDLHGQEDLSAYAFSQIEGRRDGDVLNAQARFSDGQSPLAVELHFTVGMPTRLQSGRWNWMHDGRLMSGSVTERSVMFLGGQNGPPSLGGSFDLLDESGVPAYRIAIPTTELESILPSARRTSH